MDIDARILTSLDPKSYSSFHFIFHYPNITLCYPIISLYKSYITHYSSFHFIFHYPNITPKQGIWIASACGMETAALQWLFADRSWAASSH